jgi:hypothetical protein
MAPPKKQKTTKKTHQKYNGLFYEHSESAGSKNIKPQLSVFTS